MIEFNRNTKRVREMDLTSLIDIVFMLVIFLMLTTSFSPAESLELTLPSSASKATKSDSAMRIQIESSGHVTIDGVAVGRSQLEDSILLRVAKDKEVQIGIYSTPGVSVQQLVTVMDMVYASGGRHVQVDRMEYGEAS